MIRPTIARNLSVLGFALSCLILALVGVTSYQRLTELREASRAVEQAHRIRIELERILSILDDLEASQRGFLLTGALTYREATDAALASLPARLEQLRSLTAGNPKLQERLAALNAHVRLKTAERRATIAAHERLGFDLPARVVITDQGKRLVDHVRTNVFATGAEEGRLFTERTEREQRVGRAAVFTTLGGLTLAVLLAVAATVLLNHAVREHARADAARLAAEVADRAKDEFLAVLSHELRTPLTSILGWARMLRAGRLKEDDQPRALEVIERSAQLQATLINDLLDIARFMRGVVALDRQVVELGPVVEAAIDGVRADAEDKGVGLQCSLDARPPSVLGDVSRLQQIVGNLLTNAIKFTPAGGRVTITLRREGRSAHIVVSDTGQGISAEFLPHVFERFRQEAVRGQAGLGLGLAIVHRLVELHGGRVTAESEGEGKGTVFTVSLPLV